MHKQAYDGFARMLTQTGIDPQGRWLCLDVGGADVNGSVRGQLPRAEWFGLDIAAAPGVDIVADAATWALPGETYGYRGAGFDVVTATELFEHAEQWREIIKTMADALDPGGPQVLIVTCASTGRPEHGARGEDAVPAGQYYGNVDHHELRAVLEAHFVDAYVEFAADPGDAYGWARGVR